jgi:PIN domain nuclease of toxin-antitoxin system
MSLLLDTQILLDLLEQARLRLPASMREELEQGDRPRLVSVASIWEIAIKARQGKLAIAFPLDQLADKVKEFGLRLLDINSRHVLHRLETVPATLDPFDRLLLATAAVEEAQLMTVDRKLVDHPLAWRPAA